MLRHIAFVFALAATLSGCDRLPGAVGKKQADAVPVKLMLASQGIITGQGHGLASGSVVTGSIQSEHKAYLRAEMSAVVLQVLIGNGDVVKRGDVLARMDETPIRDNLTSANDFHSGQSLPVSAPCILR